MSLRDETQKLIIRGAVAEAGIEDKFKEFLKDFSECHDSLTNEKEQAAFVLAMGYFAIEMQAKYG